MLDREYLLKKKQEYIDQADAYQKNVYALQGAAQAMDELIAVLDTEQTLTISELGKAPGAVEIGEPESL